MFGNPCISFAELSNEQQELLAEICEELIDELDINRAPDIVRRRFGLGVEDQTLRVIGDFYGVSGDRVRQIEAKSLRRMKHPSRSRRLREFLANSGFPEYAPSIQLPTRADEFMSRVYNGDTLTAEELQLVTIDDLALSVRSHNALLLDDIATLADLRSKSKRYLLRLPNFGRKALAEIEQVIAKFGVVLEE